MMKSVLLILAIVLVAVFAHEHGEKHGDKHGDKQGDKLSMHKNASVCHYRTTKGVDYDLRLLDHSSVTDLQYFDAATSTTYYFRPCGPVTSYASCPAGSSVCAVSSNGKALNFGTSKVIQWADGVEDHASVEAAYGNGEVCNNGASRKTFVEYVCNLQKTTPSNSISSVSMIDECTAKFVIESAYACPVANFCTSLTTSETCNNQLNLCQWAGGKCQAVTGCWLTRHLKASGLVAIVFITSAGVLLACTFGLCVCACRKRRACRRRRGVLVKCSRKNNKNARKTPAKKVTKNENVEYAPFQMPFQLVPGGFAPVNPYSNIQGYPMVTLAAPTVDENDQV